MRAGADADMALDAFLVFYMAKLFDFFSDHQAHRACICAFIAAAGTCFRLSDFVWSQFLKPAEPESESADTAAESPLSKQKNQYETAGQCGHADQHDRSGNP